MTRVAVSGSHQVGKSTVINAVRDHVGVAGNVMRSLAEAGLGVAANTTPRTIEAYVRAQLKSERQASKKQQHLVSDRVVLDGLAYVEAAVRRREASYPWSRPELELLGAAARLHAASFDLHVFIPIEFTTTSELPFHAGGEAFRKLVSDLIQHHLEDEWPTPVIRITGSPEERAVQMRAALKIAELGR